MKYKETYKETFTSITEKLKKKKGYHLFTLEFDSSTRCETYSFATKEEFDKNFASKKHPYYPGNMIIPKNILKTYGDSVDCLINGDEYYINLSSLYFVAEGELVK